jgi:hypothetical protein
VALGPILLAGLGVAAAMFLVVTHVEGEWDGNDYLLAGLARRWLWERAGELRRRLSPC